MSGKPEIIEWPGRAFVFRGEIFKTREEAEDRQRIYALWKLGRFGFFVGLAIGAAFGAILPHIF